jgi:hypothetical protein
VKKNETENDATGLPHGTDSSTESSVTMSTEPFAMTPKLAQSGVAENATASDTQARSSRLNVADEQRLWRIRKDRANRFMVSAPDVDFLLEILERLDR